MIIFKKIVEFKNYLRKLKNKKKKIGFIPTMGALHDGHFSLISRSISENDLSIISIFINPTQFNNQNDLSKITRNTAAVILETIQGGAGFIQPINGYLTKVQKKCNEVGALLILDEIQPGIGRTGKLFGFENYNCIPDVVVTGKGLGGGMPIGAFTASKEMMNSLSVNPKLGHITTFGGHPVIAAAALATLKEITCSTLMKDALFKENLIRKELQHPIIKEIRGKGLMLALIVESAEIANKIVLQSKENGLILFWLLFEPKAIRISPPLTITKKELLFGCDIITKVLNSI